MTDVCVVRLRDGLYSLHSLEGLAHITACSLLGTRYCHLSITVHMVARLHIKYTNYALCRYCRRHSI